MHYYTDLPRRRPTPVVTIGTVSQCGGVIGPTGAIGGEVARMSLTISSPTSPRFCLCYCPSAPQTQPCTSRVAMRDRTGSTYSNLQAVVSWYQTTGPKPACFLFGACILVVCVLLLALGRMGLAHAQHARSLQRTEAAIDRTLTALTTKSHPRESIHDTDAEKRQTRESWILCVVRDGCDRRHRRYACVHAVASTVFPVPHYRSHARRTLHPTPGTWYRA